MRPDGSASASPWNGLILTPDDVVGTIWYASTSDAYSETPRLWRFVVWKPLDDSPTRFDAIPLQLAITGEKHAKDGPPNWGGQNSQ